VDLSLRLPSFGSLLRASPTIRNALAIFLRAPPVPEYPLMLRYHVGVMPRVIIRILPIAVLLIPRLHSPTIRQPAAVVIVINPLQRMLIRGQSNHLDPFVACAVGMELPVCFGARVVRAVLIIVHLGIGLALPHVGSCSEGDVSRVLGSAGDVGVVVFFPVVRLCFECGGQWWRNGVPRAFDNYAVDHDVMIGMTPDLVDMSVVMDGAVGKDD